MELRADSGGFLLGSEPVDLSGEQSQLQILRAIKADTAAMRASIAGMARASVEAVKAPIAARTSTQEAASSPRRRREADSNLSAASGVSGTVARRRERVAVTDAVQAVAEMAGPTVSRRDGIVSARTLESPAKVATPARNANGRFLSRGNQPRNDDGDDSGGAGEGKKSRGVMGWALGKLGDVAGKLRESVSGLFSGSEQVDPAIAAAKEVGDIVSPLAAPIKGMGSLLFGGKDEQADREKTEKKIAVPWYRRLWNELRDLNEKPGGGGGSSKVTLGGLGGLLMKLPGIGLLGSLLGKLGGGLKPLLGLLGKAALPLAGIFSSFKSFSTSTEDYAKRMGVELNGGILQELGVRFVGVLGDFGNTLTFGLAGKFGEYIAPAVSKMVDSMVGAWGRTSKWVEGKWSEAIGKFNGVIERLTGLVDGARKWIADKAGVVVDKVKAVAAPVLNTAKEAKAITVKAAKDAGTAVSNGYHGAKEAAIVSGGRLVGRLDKGFRHKESFEGIKGGDGLARNGRYTNSEAARIRELKTSGANTGGHLKGGMPLPVRNKIIDEATKAGLDPQTMLEIAAVESGGNANAISSTGAIGIYQMTGGTASGLGITDRFDMDQNIAGGMKLAQENAASLRKAGLPTTRDNLYMMHQLGPRAAREIIQGAANGSRMDQLSQTTQAAAGFNIGKGSKTASQYLAANSAALDTKIGKAQAAVPPSVARKPAAVPTVKTAPSIATAAPSADRQAVPPVPSVPRKMASNEKKAHPPMLMEQPLTQNLADRGLAQAATGGLGMNIGGR